MPKPLIYALVSSKKVLDVMVNSMIDNRALASQFPAFTAKVDPSVPKGELHIRDAHGHLFASFTLKK